jgi:UDP-N-acetylmuramate-alanine ligase
VTAAGPRGVRYRASMAEALDELVREASAGDAILTIGAGSVGRAAEELAARLDRGKSAVTHAH